MTTKELIGKRFAELHYAAVSLQVTKDRSGVTWMENITAWTQWATSAENLLRLSFGADSIHYRRFTKAIDAEGDASYLLDSCTGIFAAAESDFEGGYTFQIEKSIAGEIFADFNEAAKIALTTGYKDVAAVLACAALEDALKRLARFHGLAVDEKEMTTVINALKTAGVIVGAEKKIFDSLPNIRNGALHARWDEVSDLQVRTVIGVVESILLKHFGSGYS
jgi:hypothetical protein